MKVRLIAAVFVTGLLLGGCSSWNSAMSYVGLRDSEDTAPPAAPPANTEPATPAPATADAKSDAWCKEVAKSAASDAADNGFDAATQRRRAVTAYRQCAASPAP